MDNTKFVLTPDRAIGDKEQQQYTLNRNEIAELGELLKRLLSENSTVANKGRRFSRMLKLLPNTFRTL